MKHYFIAKIKITDPSEYEKYLDSVDEVFSKYKGEYLAVDENPTILEGRWDYTKSDNSFYSPFVTFVQTFVSFVVQ